MAPALRAGLGALVSNPLSGNLMLLRTRGSRSGRVREAPLGYVILDCAVYCAAGFGAGTAWYRNLLADPEVEVVLPGRTFVGRAEPVVDSDEWVRAYRALIGSFGLLGRGLVGDVGRLDDTTLFERHHGIPVVRIRPTALRPGAFDPGGGGWIAVWATLAATAVLVPRVLRPRRRVGAAPTAPPRGPNGRSERTVQGR